MIDFEAEAEIATAEAVERLFGWTAPARAALGIGEPSLGPNGAQRARAALAEGRSVREIYAGEVARTRATFAADARA